ncbi:hypothetical protein Tco_1468204, partial [Tanacetum coccineum]
VRFIRTHENNLKLEGPETLPLSGYVEVHYDDPEKRVVSKPIEMT